MIEKRSNPFGTEPSEQTEQEEAKLQKRINPLTLESIAPAQTPVVKEQSALEAAPVTLIHEKPKKPNYISGKYKKKTVRARVSKALITELLAVTGEKKPGAIIEAALLQYAFEEKPKAFMRAKTELESKGCEIK